MKDKLYLSPKLYVGKSSTHGYGVFTSEDLKKSEIVEQAYYIIPDNEKTITHNTLGKDRINPDKIFSKLIQIID